MDLSLEWANMKTGLAPSSIKIEQAKNRYEEIRNLLSIELENLSRAKYEYMEAQKKLTTNMLSKMHEPFKVCVSIQDVDIIHEGFPQAIMDKYPCETEEMSFNEITGYTCTIKPIPPNKFTSLGDPVEIEAVYSEITKIIKGPSTTISFGYGKSKIRRDLLIEFQLSRCRFSIQYFILRRI